MRFTTVAGAAPCCRYSKNISIEKIATPLKKPGAAEGPDTGQRQGYWQITLRGKLFRSKAIPAAGGLPELPEHSGTFCRISGRKTGVHFSWKCSKRSLTGSPRGCVQRGSDGRSDPRAGRY
ncbi:hypothetical protein CFBP7129_01630 [Agrobacterium tumefaciens]|uniref:Uncharacterized protein n=1 Tax=Agrobacterium tumefaciens TaxID=358 RepID=A0A4D7Y887_AGRTU|nr:hypothetical protein CFBP7129_01630 [Agrobacterium tumefaciens]